MLVKTGQNMMRIILKMMSEAEAVCVKVGVLLIALKVLYLHKWAVMRENLSPGFPTK